MILRARYDGLHELRTRTEFRFVIFGEVAARTGRNLIYPPGFRRELVVGETIFVAPVNDNPSDYILIGVEQDTLGDVWLENDKSNVALKEDGKIEINGSDTVEVSGSDHGGLVKWPELEKQLQKVSDYMEGIKDALSNAATGAQDGGATYKTNVVLNLKKLELPDYKDVESDAVLHGKGVDSKKKADNQGSNSTNSTSTANGGTTPGPDNQKTASNRHLVNSKEDKKLDVQWIPMRLTTSKLGQDFIKGYEEFRKNPYRATTGGNWTVGYGHELDVHPVENYTHISGFWDFYTKYLNDKDNPANIGIVRGRESITSIEISEKMALAILKQDLEWFEEGINKHFEGGRSNVPGYPEYANGRHLRQCEFDALVSFSFNTSRSRLLDTDFFQIVQREKNFELLTVQKDILKEWQGYNKGLRTNQILDGLIRRRKDEVEIFFRGQYGINPANNAKSFVPLTEKDLRGITDIGGPVPNKDKYLIPKQKGINTNDIA